MAVLDFFRMLFGTTPEVGKIYRYRSDDNPFVSQRKVKVLAVKNGFVKYEFLYKSPTYSGFAWEREDSCNNGRFWESFVECTPEELADDIPTQELK